METKEPLRKLARVVVAYIKQCDGVNMEVDGEK
jgi:hypothetical protein